MQSSDDGEPFNGRVEAGQARLAVGQPTEPAWYSVRKGLAIRGRLLIRQSFDLDYCLTGARREAPALVIERDERDWSSVVWPRRRRHA